MAKRKHHDPRKRVRSMLRGSKITFDGNEKNLLDYRLSGGLPMSKIMVDAATGWAWRWKITLGLVCELNGAKRYPSEELTTETAIRINDLTSFVKERHQIMALEQPGAWKVVAQTWQIELLG